MFPFNLAQNMDFYEPLESSNVHSFSVRYYKLRFFFIFRFQCIFFFFYFFFYMNWNGFIFSSETNSVMWNRSSNFNDVAIHTRRVWWRRHRKVIYKLRTLKKRDKGYKIKQKKFFYFLEEYIFAASRLLIYLWKFNESDQIEKQKKK